jgi:hypothetical protein
VHDFGLAGRHAVVYLSPYLLDMEGFVAGGKTVLDCLAWEPERGSRLLVARREDGEAVASIDVGRGYCLHLINAFEEAGEAGEERLVVDVVELEEPVYPDYLGLPDMFVDVAPGQPVRRVIDLAAGRVVEERALDYVRACDFPSLHPATPSRAYDDFWLLGITATGQPGRKFFDELVAPEVVGDGVAAATWRRRAASTSAASRWSADPADPAPRRGHRPGARRRPRPRRLPPLRRLRRRRRPARPPAARRAGSAAVPRLLRPGVGSYPRGSEGGAPEVVRPAAAGRPGARGTRRLGGGWGAAAAAHGPRPAAGGGSGMAGSRSP